MRSGKDMILMCVLVYAVYLSSAHFALAQDENVWWACNVIAEITHIKQADHLPTGYYFSRYEDDKVSVIDATIRVLDVTPGGATNCPGKEDPNQIATIQFLTTEYYRDIGPGFVVSGKALFQSALGETGAITTRWSIYADIVEDYEGQTAQWEISAYEEYAKRTVHATPQDARDVLRNMIPYSYGYFVLFLAPILIFYLLYFLYRKRSREASEENAPQTGLNTYRDYLIFLPASIIILVAIYPNFVMLLSWGALAFLVFFLGCIPYTIGILKKSRKGQTAAERPKVMSESNSILAPVYVIVSYLCFLGALSWSAQTYSDLILTSLFLALSCLIIIHYLANRAPKRLGVSNISPLSFGLCMWTGFFGIFISWLGSEPQYLLSQEGIVGTILDTSHGYWLNLPSLFVFVTLLFSIYMSPILYAKTLSVEMTHQYSYSRLRIILEYILLFVMMLATAIGFFLYHGLLSSLQF